VKTKPSEEERNSTTKPSEEERNSTTKHVKFTPRQRHYYVI